MAKRSEKDNSKSESASPAAAGAGTSSDGIRETIESIVVAFILAFVFRAFIVEAFIIPTGSMASTLYGKHGTLICEDCGWENTYGLTDQSSHRGGRFSANAEVVCQNCGHHNTNLVYNDGVVGRFHASSASGSNAEAGDRILVLKWPLDLGIDALGPARWDVTVFKNPANANENFIKRLLGLPEEVLEIIDGDVYAVPISELSQRTLGTLNELRDIKYRQRTGQSVSSGEARRLRQPMPQFMRDELSKKLHICRKTANAQRSLWTVVYHHDYPPMEPEPGQPRWIDDGGPASWSAAHRRLTFHGGDGQWGRVRFDGKEITDQNTYNIDVGPRSWNPVSDLRLEGVLHASGGQGFVEFTLGKRHVDFTVRLSVNGEVTLFESGAGSQQRVTIAGTLVSPLTSRVPVAFVFQNVDYRVSFEIDGRQVLATSDSDYAPELETLRDEEPPTTRAPFITASDLDVELRHVVLLRDEYYTSPSLDRNGPSSWGIPGWGTTNHPILLRSGEYFMLGDNSAASKDSRLWDEVGAHLTERGDAYQLGTVPEDQLVGRAFFIYWPAGLRLPWLPVLDDFGIIPNLGKMRWIR